MCNFPQRPIYLAIIRDRKTVNMRVSSSDMHMSVSIINMVFYRAIVAHISNCCNIPVCCINVGRTNFEICEISEFFSTVFSAKPTFSVFFLEKKVKFHCVFLYISVGCFHVFSYLFNILKISVKYVTRSLWNEYVFSQRQQNF